MERTYEIEIAAPAAAVFVWLTDGKKMKQWMDGLEAFTYEQTGRSLQGVTFQQTMRTPFSRVTWNGIVTEFAEGEALGLSLQAPLLSMEIAYSLEQTNGMTLLRQRCSIHLRPWLGMTKTMVIAFCDAMFQQQLGRLKTCAESA